MEDIETVINHLEDATSNLKTKGYSNVTDFKFYINRIIENFRESDKTIKTIAQIKPIVVALTY